MASCSACIRIVIKTAYKRLWGTSNLVGVIVNPPLRTASSGQGLRIYGLGFRIEG